MPASTGQQEVARRISSLDQTFSRVASINDLEVRSDFARYLTILVTGFLERSLQELALEHARRQSSPSVRNYVERQLGRLRNADKNRLLEVVGSFDQSWREELEQDFADELESVASLYSNRHRIAHGDSVGVSYVTAEHHYVQTKRLVARLNELFLP